MKGKQSFLMVGILAFILVMSVGYALFSESLNIGGSATTTGTFDVEITRAVVESETGSSGATIIINDNKNGAVISAPSLQYPGASAVYNITITNKGNIPTKLSGIFETGLDEDENVTISYEGISTEDDILYQNDTKTFKVTVAWNEDSTATSSNVQFNLELKYQQAV